MVKFSRSFITFLEFDKVVKNKIQSGKALVELKDGKCKLFLWLQNLEDDTFYNIYFIYLIEDKRYGVYITDVFVGREGKSELKYIFDLKDVFSNNIKIEDYLAIGIIKIVDDISYTALIGYKKDVFDWDNNFIRLGYKNDYEEELKKDLEIDNHINENILKNDMFKLNKDETFINEKIQAKEKELEEHKNDFKSYVLSYRKKHKEIEKKEIDLLEKINIVEKKDDFIKVNDEKIIIEDNIEDTELLYKNINLEKIFKSGEEVKPFKKQNRNVLWRKIDVKEIYKIKTLQEILNNKNVLASYSQRNDFILGVVEDFIGYDYYFGVPDFYNIHTKDSMYNLGFIQFKPIEEKMPTHESDGYWIMKL